MTKKEEGEWSVRDPQVLSQDLGPIPWGGGGAGGPGTWPIYIYIYIYSNQISIMTDMNGI